MLQSLLGIHESPWQRVRINRVFDTDVNELLPRLDRIDDNFGDADYREGCAYFQMCDLGLSDLTVISSIRDLN
jgi:hypothetical protein